MPANEGEVVVIKHEPSDQEGDQAGSGFISWANQPGQSSGHNCRLQDGLQVGDGSEPPVTAFFQTQENVQEGVAYQDGHILDHEPNIHTLEVQHGPPADVAFDDQSNSAVTRDPQEAKLMSLSNTANEVEYLCTPSSISHKYNSVVPFPHQHAGSSLSSPLVPVGSRRLLGTHASSPRIAGAKRPLDRSSTHSSDSAARTDSWGFPSPYACMTTAGKREYLLQQIKDMPCPSKAIPPLLFFMGMVLGPEEFALLEKKTGSQTKPPAQTVLKNLPHGSPSNLQAVPNTGGRPQLQHGAPVIASSSVAPTFSSGAKASYDSPGRESQARNIHSGSYDSSAVPEEPSNSASTMSIRAPEYSYTQMNPSSSKSTPLRVPQAGKSSMQSSETSQCSQGMLQKQWHLATAAPHVQIGQSTLGAVPEQQRNRYPHSSTISTSSLLPARLDQAIAGGHYQTAPQQAHVPVATTSRNVRELPVMCPEDSGKLITGQKPGSDLRAEGNLRGTGSGNECHEHLSGMYRNIIRVVEGWQIRVPFSEGALNIHSVPVCDPEVAAINADRLLFKLRGPKADTNFVLPDAECHLLGRMEIQELLDDLNSAELMVEAAQRVKVLAELSTHTAKQYYIAYPG